MRADDEGHAEIGERRGRRRAWIPIVWAVVGLGVLWLCARALQGLELLRVREVLLGASVVPVVAAGVFVLVQAACKAERWRLMLGHAPPIPRLEMLHYFLVARAATLVLPLSPAGMVMRVHLLRRRHGIPIARSLAVLTIEKLFDAIGLLFVVAPLPLALSLPDALSRAITLLVAAGTTVAVLAVLLGARAARSGRLGTRWAFLQPAVASLAHPRIFASSVGWSVVAHLADCASLTLLFGALGLGVTPVASGLILLTLSFAMVVPLTPAQIGPLEAGTVWALGLVGVPAERALALALVYHALSVVPILVVGATGLPLVAEGARERDADVVGPSGRPEE